MSTLTSARPRVLKRRKPNDRAERLTVGQYLLKRLAEIGVAHLFLTPGSHLERLEELIATHPKINLISNPSPHIVAAMADGYGKAKGIACLATEAPRGDLVDAFLRASSESVPLVAIVGKTEAKLDEVFCFLEEILRQCTCGWTEIAEAKLAAKKIDRVLDACLFYKKPVCIELPQEVIDHYIPQHYYSPAEFEPSDPDSLEEALLDCVLLLSKAKHPLLYIGREVLAQKAESLLLYFAERWHIPVASSLLAKNYLLQSHPNYCGDLTQSLIEKSDLILLFGSHDTIPHTIQVASTSVTIKNKVFANINLKEMIVSLCAMEPQKPKKLWYSRQRNPSLRDDLFLVTCDPSLLLKMAHFFAADVISSATHTPQYAIASAIGASYAHPHKFPIVILKESELEASLTELYTAQKQGIAMLICVEGHANWLKPHFPEITILRRKMPHLPTKEMAIVTLE